MLDTIMEQRQDRRAKISNGLMIIGALGAEIGAAGLILGSWFAALSRLETIVWILEIAISLMIFLTGLQNHSPTPFVRHERKPDPPPLPKKRLETIAEAKARNHVPSRWTEQDEEFIRIIQSTEGKPR